MATHALDSQVQGMSHKTITPRRAVLIPVTDPADIVEILPFTEEEAEHIAEAGYRSFLDEGKDQEFAEQYRRIAKAALKSA